MSDLPVIFIVGASRSGTTMMNHLLGGNSQILALHELHYIGNYWHLGKTEVWERTRAEQETARLLATARRSVWNNSPSDEDVQEASLIMSGIDGDRINPGDIYARTLHHLRHGAGKSLVIDQTPRNIYFAEKILETFPGAQVVQLIRDPRAVLYSQRNRWRQKWLGASKTPIWNSIRVRVNYHPITASKLWVRAYEFGTGLSQHPRFLRVPFESLVREPEKYLKKICAQLGVNYEEKMLDIPNIGSSTRQHDAGKRGVEAQVATTWRGKLPDVDTWICQRVTKTERRTLGYDSVDIGRPLLGVLMQVILFPFHLLGVFAVNPRLAFRVWAAMLRISNRGS